MTQNTRSLLIRSLVVAGLVGLASVVAACQTVKGLGQDIQYAGEKSEQAITK